jgi:hypothetical protein
MSYSETPVRCRVMRAGARSQGKQSVAIYSEPGGLTMSSGAVLWSLIGIVLIVVIVLAVVRMTERER